MEKIVSFIFLRKLFEETKSSVSSEETELNITSRKCVQRGSKILKIDFGWGRVAHAPGLWPRIFRLLANWPTGQKVQNDHCHRFKIMPISLFLSTIMPQALQLRTLWISSV